jgi:putative hydrolase of the HAD superfamily
MGMGDDMKAAASIPRRSGRGDGRPLWLLDLDNTLHDASERILPQIDRSMTRYIEQHLGVAREHADRLRRHYWQRYGATLLGLMRHHGVDPAHFLARTHDPEELDGTLVAHGALASVLQRLPGRRVVFTNGPAAYARWILGRLGVLGQIDALYAIEHVRFVPKPAPASFRAVLAAEGRWHGPRIMVEDSLANLRGARRLGLTTVWLSRDGLRVPAHVDWRITSIAGLPRIAQRIRAATGRA